MASDLDELRVTNLDTGAEFTLWESATVSSDFLTPCDSFRLEAGAEMAGPELARKLPNGAIVRIDVNGHPQLTGYVDKTTLSADRGGGRKVTIEGRDHLSRVVDGNIDPRMQIPKHITIAELCLLVLKQQFAYEIGIVPTNNASRDLAAGKPVGSKTVYTAKHKREQPLKDLTPHDNEGAFSYLSRILTHHGYWLWGSVMGDYVVIAGPDYAQPPAYNVINRFSLDGKASSANNVIESSASLDETSVPSHVYCRGTSSSKGTKAAVVGEAVNGFSSHFKPAYIADKDATSKEKAERIARTFLARQMRNYFVYECTMAGFSDRANQAVYAVDAVALVDDTQVGCQGRMWIESRTFQKSRSGGTTTRLKMIPLNTLVLDWQPDESPSAIDDYVKAIAQFKPGSPFAKQDFDINGTEFFAPNK